MTARTQKEAAPVARLLHSPFLGDLVPELEVAVVGVTLQNTYRICGSGDGGEHAVLRDGPDLGLRRPCGECRRKRRCQPLAVERNRCTGRSVAEVQGG